MNSILQSVHSNIFDIIHEIFKRACNRVNVTKRNNKKHAMKNEKNRRNPGSDRRRSDLQRLFSLVLHSEVLFVFRVYGIITRYEITCIEKTLKLRMLSYHWWLLG